MRFGAKWDIVVPRGGFSPLHGAAAHGYAEAVTALLSGGANASLPDFNGWTPLHWASGKGHIAVVEALVVAGASTEAKNALGDRPVDVCPREEHVLRNLLHQAALARMATDQVEQRIKQAKALLHLGGGDNQLITPIAQELAQLATNEKFGDQGFGHTDVLLREPSDESQFASGSAWAGQFSAGNSFGVAAFPELEVGQLVGRGAYAEVYDGKFHKERVAIKRLIPIGGRVTDREAAAFQKEVVMLRDLRHPNIVEFKAALSDPPNLVTITEFMTRGSLWDLLHGKKENREACMMPNRALQMLCDVGRGLVYLHGRGIVHRDIKSPNLLVGENWEVKIADFGISRLMATSSMEMTGHRGTTMWMAPEVMRHEPYNQSADIFGFAMVMYELFMGMTPFEGLVLPTDSASSPESEYLTNEEAKVWQIARMDRRPRGDPAHYPADAKQLMHECWDKDPAKRPSAVEALRRLEVIRSQL